MNSKKRGRSAVSGLTGGSSVVSGPNRKGSAGGPVSRTKRAKRIEEQAKSSSKTALRETNQAKRGTAKAKHNTKIAADPDNIGRLSPSERTPSAARKKPYRTAGDVSEHARTAIKVDAVRKRMATRARAKKK